VKITLPRPHSQGQKDLILSTQNDVVFAGRRWGKTHTGVQRIVRSALNNKGLYWWVGLGWKSASLKRAWRELKLFATAVWKAKGEKPEKYIRESMKELTLPGGSEIWMRTAERPDSLAGEGIKGCVLDEFTLMQELVWTEYVEATLLDHNGWAMFIGVPKGNNWGAKLWKNCLEGPNENWRGRRKGWKAHHYPTISNPLIKPELLEDIRQNTPQALFEQEYLAAVIEHAGLVFRNIDTCFTSEPLDGPLEGHTYVFGLDWGKSNDFTCVPILDVDERRLVYLGRFNELDYTLQLANIRDLCRVWNPRSITAESNAMGEPLCDQLISDGLPINKFYTTNVSKREIIEALQVAIEQHQIGLYDDRNLVTELEEFEMSLTSQGNVRYYAPEGGHDDCVMSLALAWNEVRYDLGISL
jgi:hypothetical protein